MINHFRTILLNEKAVDQSKIDREMDVYGFTVEQFIDDKFSPTKYDEVSAIINAAVFGQRGDSLTERDYASFIATILTSMVYSTKWSFYIDQIDGRSTYDYRMPKGFPATSKNIILPGSTGAEKFFINGSIVGGMATGIFRDVLSLTRAGDYSLSVSREATPEVKIVSFTSLSSDVSQEFRLCPGVNGQFIGLSPTEVPANFNVSVSLVAPMIYSIHGCLERIFSSGGRRVFTDGVTKHVEAMKNLANVFDNSTMPHEKLAAVLIAHVLRISERL